MAIGLAVGGEAAAQQASQTSTSRWTPWTGCWPITTGEATRAPARPTGVPAVGTRRGRVCVEAAGDTATLTTISEDGKTLTQTVQADGVPHDWSDGACTGAQTARWSSDGHRVYTSAELTCPGGARRRVSGLALLAADGTWVETQALSIEGRESVRVRRFSRESDRSSERAAAARRLTTDDVKDMAGQVAAPAIEAALVETRSTFALTAARLIDLEAAGVPSPVIDLMIAMTFPQAYRVRAEQPSDRLSTLMFDDEPLLVGGSWWPGSWAGGAAYYDSAYYLLPFGYSSLGAYPVLSGIAVGGGSGVGTGRRSRQEADTGRVVNGRGYTRVEPRRAEPAESSAASSGAGPSEGGSVSARGYTRGSDTAGATSAPASSGSSGGASGGSSGSSSSGDTGRTAVPR
jgi:hypothetical protein